MRNTWRATTALLILTVSTGLLAVNIPSAIQKIGNPQGAPAAIQPATLVLARHKTIVPTTQSLFRSIELLKRVQFSLSLFPFMTDLLEKIFVQLWNCAA